ncbi:hypothetical protein TYRP_016399 [Tyrophagus putrescentiae]|nr:hypothetical protein TYRP_016399 [Tyrophagus putrescentiae]
MPPKTAPKSARKSAGKSSGKSARKSARKSAGKSAVKSASAKSGSRRKSLKVKAPKKGKQKRPPKKARYATVTQRGKEVEAKLKEMVSADMQKHRQQPHAKLKEFLKKLAPKSKRPAKGNSANKLSKSVKSSKGKGKMEKEDEENVSVEITTTLPKEEPTKADAKTSIVPKSRKSIKSIAQPKSTNTNQPPTEAPPASENAKNSGSDDAGFEVIKSDVGAPLGAVAANEPTNQIAAAADLPDVPQLHKMIKDIVLSTNRIKKTLQQKKTASTSKTVAEPPIKENLPPDG